MSPLLMRAPARALVLAVALAAPSAALVAPSYAGSTSSVAQDASEEATTTPQDLQVEVSRDGSVRVSWTPGGAEVTAYDVFVTNPSDENSSFYQDVDADTLEWTFEGLPAGTYDVAVYGRSDAREDPPATQEGVVVEEAEEVESNDESTPQDFKAEQFGAGEIYLSWTPGEVTPSSYRIEVNPDDESGAAYSDTVDGETTETVFEDVAVGSYNISITPLDGDREGEAAYAEIEVVEAPGAVRSFKAKQVAPGKVTLTWAKPSSGPVTGYFAGVSRSESGDGKPVGKNATSTSFANLRPGKYTFELRAANGTVGGKASRMALTVTNTVKRGAPTLSVADTSLTRTQKVRASGTAPKGAQVELEFRPKGYSDFFVVGFDKADRKGRWSVSADLPQSGTLRAVAAATGRVSATKAVTKR